MPKRTLIALSAVVALAALAAPAAARAEDKILGKVTRIEMASKEAKVATATLQDDSGRAVVITVEDKLTLDKFADRRISVGDEVKCKYLPKGGKNVSTFFKKPGGCS